MNWPMTSRQSSRGSGSRGLINAVNFPRRILCFLAAGLAIFAFAKAAHAQQSADDAKAILTANEWSLRGHGYRRFLADGSMTSRQKANNGTWQIDGTVLDIKDASGLEWQFPLPINPKGNKGAGLQNSEAALLISLSPSEASKTGGEKTEAVLTSTAPIPVRAYAPRTTTTTTYASAPGIIQAHHDSLVFVTGTAGAGSGFIVKMGTGGNFLITNCHVMAGLHDAGFKTLAGEPVRPGVPSMAVGEDIFCMSAPAGGSPFEMMDNVDVNAAVGDEVVVLGNAAGGGVVNTITGRIVGIGPNLVEVDAPFIPGNSGSPIVHLKTGKVIGVATYTVTYQNDQTTERKLPKPVIRRFGYRLDTVKNWQAVQWQSFYVQAAEMERIKGLTDNLISYVESTAGRGGRFGAGGGDPLIRQQIDNWHEEKGERPSKEQAADADTHFISAMKSLCESGIPQARQEITYDYFRRDLDDQIQLRDQLAGCFQQVLQKMGP
jgi:S1-C subfamily serine protease